MTRARIITVSIILVSSLTQSINADMYYDSKIINISGGENHTLILTANNWPWAAGDNQWRQLGIGNNSYDRPMLVRVHGPSDVNFLQNITAVASGWKHSLALDANSTIWAFGDNYEGEIGNNQVHYVESIPVQVHGLNNVGLLDGIVSISAGRSGEHSLALDVNMNVLAWGSNWVGELGDGTTAWKLTPVYVCAGDQNPIDPNSPLSGVVAISGGAKHSMALAADGRVFTFGSDDAGKLGAGSVGMQTRPVAVHAGEQNPGDPDDPLQNIVAVSAGWEHCLALECLDPGNPDCQGRVYAWGANDYRHVTYGGRLGDGTYENHDKPVIVHAGEQNPGNPNGPLTGIISIAAGEGHGLALDINGYLWTWGSDMFGELGNDTDNMDSLTPVRVMRFDGQPLSYINIISAGYWHNLAVDVNGTLWVWGKGTEGACGLGDKQDKTLAYPRPAVFNLTRYRFQFGIQPAIDDACNLDVLEAWPGTYFEQDVDYRTKTLTLQSTNPWDWSVVEQTIVQAEDAGSGIKFTASTAPVLAGLSVAGATYGIYCTAGSPLIERCILRDNITDGLYATAGWPELRDCRIHYNNGVGIEAVGGTIIDCLIHHNQGSGISCGGGNFTIERCRILDNQNEGINLSVQYVFPTIKIIDNWICGNGTDGSGSGVAMTFLGSSSQPVLRNNTIAENATYGVSVVASSARAITNCILWGNNTAQINGPLNATYCCVQGGYAGAGNIGSNPCFVNPDSNNFHLDTNSPCIDKGINSTITDPNETDIDGEPRIADGDFNGIATVDMGADEFYWAPPDFNHDGIVNFIDFALFATAWQTGTGNPDYNDIYDLSDNNFIDCLDLAEFCDWWLWIAPWSDSYETLMSQAETGMGIASENMIASESLRVTPESPEMSLSFNEQLVPDESPDIDLLIDWLDDAWLAGEITEALTEQEYLAFRQSLAESAD